jgi:hypothetical protein
MTEAAHDLLDRAAAAVLLLAGSKPWRDVALKDVAIAADVPFADLYASAPSKRAVMDWLSSRYDLAALKNGHDADVHDRLFEAVMARIEAMEPHRAALLSVAADENALVQAPRLACTARALLEGAGVDTSGTVGALRLAAMTAVWTRILQVWRADEGALNRTMAEADRRLKQMRDGLGRVGAGF